MDSVSILQVLANSYLYGWAGAAIFLVLFIILLRQNTIKGAIVNKLKKENKDMEQRLSENSEKISELEAQVESLTEETEEKTAEIDRLKDRLASVEKELNEKSDKLKELEEELSNYRKENAELKARVSELEKKTADQEALIEQKDNEIANFKEDISRLEKELEELQFNYNISVLYIHMKKLYEEFTKEYTQNILKGINTMKISDIDMTTAQAIFEHAMRSFFDSSEQPVPQEEEETHPEEEEETETS